MYRIGEFSYLCECTIKTLRHYEKMGILIPKEVDDFTGYRYYSEEQVSTYHNIKTLQEAGFTLKEIKNILDNPNEDALIHIKKIEEKFKTTDPTYDSKYVGKWILQGQIVEPDKLFNPNKEHFMPDTKYKELILYKEGTTNYDNISWRDDYLIIENNGKIIDNRLYQETSKDGTRYLGILMNDLNINSRPYRYYYKEVK